MDLATFQELITSCSFKWEWEHFLEIIPNRFVALSYKDGETIEIGNGASGWHISRFNEADEFLAQYGAGETLEQAITNYTQQEGLS